MAAIAPPPSPPPSPPRSPPPAAEAERSDGPGGEPNGNAAGGAPAAHPAWSGPAGGEAGGGLLGPGAWPPALPPAPPARASAPSSSRSSPDSPRADDLADGLSELSVSEGTETNEVETPNHITPANRQRSTRRNGSFDSQQTSPAWRNGHQQPRSSSFRYRSGGQHVRAAGFHQQMVRHDQQRGNREWPSRQVGGFGPRFMRPVPPPPVPFPFLHPYHPVIPPQAFPLGNLLAYPPEMAPHFFPPLPPDIQAGSPFPVPPPLAVYSPLHLELLRQIEYYFSKENLIKDLHFRKEWNGQGWVHISIIASFKKVSSMTRDINLILDAIRTSTMLEIQGEMVRKRDDWEKWLVPKDFMVSGDTSPPVQ
ncbi:hypothetical protein NL676_006424 [Syzygium grande]|nr:hypothetical protein NL676_006424 [Syzygium grande]